MSTEVGEAHSNTGALPAVPSQKLQSAPPVQTGRATPPKNVKDGNNISSSADPNEHNPSSLGTNQSFEEFNIFY